MPCANDTSPRSLFRVNIRELQVPFERTRELVWHVALKRYSTVVDAVAAAKHRFTDRWWETHIITDIIELGELHILDGESLYEPPD